jgi:hypothetical protein
MAKLQIGLAGKSAEPGKNRYHKRPFARPATPAPAYDE